MKDNETNKLGTFISWVYKWLQYKYYEDWNFTGRKKIPIESVEYGLKAPNTDITIDFLISHNYYMILSISNITITSTI